MSGIFKRVGRLAGTSIDQTERVVGETLGTVGAMAQVMGNTAKEFVVESQDDLLATTINIAKKKAQYRNELKELGFSEETIENMLK